MFGKLEVLISAVSLVWCGISQAQQVSPAADSNISPGLTEIVVTAERRSTDLQQTAIAATVLSGSELQEKGINTVEDLQFSMPSVTLQNFGQGNYFSIRGIGKDVPSSAVGVGVITYRDGVATFPDIFRMNPTTTSPASRSCVARKERSSVRMRPAVRCSSPRRIRTSTAFTVTWNCSTATTTTR